MKYLFLLFAALLFKCSPLRAAAPTTGQFLFQQKPASGPFNQFGVTPLTNQVFGWDGTNVVMFGPGGGISWGSITGTLSSQTDLQTALDAKLSLTGTLALANFGSITGILPVGNLPGTVQLTTGTLSLGNFASITGTLADARLSANVQLKNGTLALAGFGSITGTLPTANLPATIPDGNLSTNVQLKNGALALAGFGSITGTMPAVNIADLSGTYLTTATAATSYQPLDGDLTALAALSGTHNIYYRSAANTWSSLTIGTGLDFTGGTLSNLNGGSVTSVALTAPAVFSVSGSPVTSTGTLALSLATQSAHAVWSGPTSGSAAAPTFRALVATDLPDISATYLTTATAASTYQPLSANLTAWAATSGTNTIYYRSAANTWTPVAIGTGITFSGGTLSSTNGGGTVTSVALSLPGIFSVSGSPVTTSGTLSATLANQTTKTFLAGPVSGAATTPTFRVIASGDIPDLSGTYLTTTAAAAAYQPLDADLTALAGLSGTNTIYYRSAADTWTAVTVGTGLTFTGGTLSASSAGTVSSVALSLPGMFSVSGSPVTTSGTLSASLANQNAHLALIGPASGSAAAPTFRLLVAGDVPDLSGTYLTPAAGNAAYQPLAANLTSLAAASTNNSIYYRVSSGTWAPVTIGSNLALSGGTLSSTGSVTSVALSAPSFLSVSGSPITSTGTLAMTLATQSANRVFSGPVSGGVSQPTFRALVAADIPDLSATYQPLNGGLTSLAAASGTHTLYYRSAANTWSAVTVGGGLDFTGATLSAVGATSVNTNLVYSGPASGSAAAPTFRSLAIADLPDLSGVYQPLSATLTTFAASTATLPTSGKIVAGATSSTDNAIALWNGTTGALIKDSAAIIDTSTNVISAAAFNAVGGGFRINGGTMVYGAGVRFFTASTNVAMASDSLVAWSSGGDGISGLDIAFARTGVGVVAPTDAAGGVGYLKTKGVTVSALPSAATVGAGTRGFVTDASTTIILGIGTTVTGGGSNKVPVYSDGTNWIIGG